MSMRRVLWHRWAIVRRSVNGCEEVAELARTALQAAERAEQLRAVLLDDSGVSYRVAPVEIVEEG